MTTTLSFTAKEISDLICQQLRAQGYEVQGPVRFEVQQGSSDPREPSMPGLAGATVKASIAQPANIPSNLLNGNY